MCYDLLKKSQKKNYKSDSGVARYPYLTQSYIGHVTITSTTLYS